MILTPRWQTILFGAVAGFTVAVQMIFQPELYGQLLILAPLVAILGLPHGALDLPIAEALWPLIGWRGKLWFLTLYLALVAGVIGVWMLVPGFALIAFLAYSVAHFSEDWGSAASPLRWTGGIATIGAPAMFHIDEVSRLFAFLVAPTTAAIAAGLTAVAGFVGICVFTAAVLFKPETRGQAAYEQAMLWAIGALLPPLMFFAVYFCGLHSIRHFNSTIQSLPRTRRALGIAALLSSLVVLAALGFVRGPSGRTANPLPADLVQVIFIGLAALTVPHMILIERFSRLSGRGHKNRHWWHPESDARG